MRISDWSLDVCSSDLRSRWNLELGTDIPVAGKWILFRSVAAAREEERAWSGKRLGPKPSCCAINGALDDPRTWPYSPDPGVRHCRSAGQPSGARQDRKCCVWGKSG